jgi:hypothetical protein
LQKMAGDHRVTYTRRHAFRTNTNKVKTIRTPGKFGAGTVVAFTLFRWCNVGLVRDSRWPPHCPVYL